MIDKIENKYRGIWRLNTMKKFDIDKGLCILIAITICILSFSFISAVMDNKNINKSMASDKSNHYSDKGGESEESIQSFTGLLVGLDASQGLTDVLMVGVMDVENNTIKVISVPRDLEIDFTDENFAHIKENNPNNNVKFCKLTEIYSLTGHNEQAFRDLEEVISIITGLEIDYMARIDVNGFSDLVDAVGGVEFDVPERMYYTDPFQDLYIDLRAGYQMLDGDKAEQLVRYRHYTMGDLQRIKVQQEFMVALFDKIMSTDDFSQVKELATAGYDMFEADFGLLFALQYAEYFFNLDVKNILSTANMVTIPSYGEKVGELWYQRWHLEEAHQVVNELLNGPAEPIGKLLRQ